ncbi:CYTL1 domain-containing protein [Betta splendens]|uniref:CYTL1 domain-containing protein n=1 Tax=Betta splendens TaxID=158456 RepID=A0A6P7PE86_BETSP|nr:CYTL1 domain-containing protein [Betta splendens]
MCQQEGVFKAGRCIRGCVCFCRNQTEPVGAGGTMGVVTRLLLALCAVPLALSYPFYPPTCYTKVLVMARDLTQWAAELKSGPETSYCMAHMPNLHLDVHNACVMFKIRDYISLVEGLRLRRCAYTRDVWKLGGTLRQLFIIMSQRCHGDLVFTLDDCSALER